MRARDEGSGATGFSEETGCPGRQASKGFAGGPEEQTLPVPAESRRVAVVAACAAGEAAVGVSGSGPSGAECMRWSLWLNGEPPWKWICWMGWYPTDTAGGCADGRLRQSTMEPLSRCEGYYRSQSAPETIVRRKRRQAAVGFEYRLRFAVPDSSAVAAVIRRLPEVREAIPPGSGFDFGHAGGGWPQATVQVETGGIYFCDHCSPGGGAVLGNLVAALVSAF